MGAVPRREPRPRSEVVGESLVVWADLDDQDAIARARIFARPAHIVVSSGSGLHLYWKVRERLAPEEAERANRRLARHLGADVAATDRLRLLRVPGSGNAKAGRRAALLRARGELPAYRLRDLLAGVGDVALAPERPARANRVELRPGTGTPREWFVALAGVEPDARGFVSCPLPDHDDPHPSCRVYETPERGWWCFGCARGGGVVDLASLLEGGPWGRELRGDAIRGARARTERAGGLTPERGPAIAGRPDAC